MVFLIMRCTRLPLALLALVLTTAQATAAEPLVDLRLPKRQNVPHWLELINDECDCYEGPKTLFMWNSPVEPTGGSPGFDEPLASDRPDFTEASSTVGRGVTQLEMGYTYAFDADGGEQTQTHRYPELLLRVGVLAEWLELRVGWSHGAERTNENGIRNSTHGSEDLYLGVKLGLTQQQGILPEMALVPQMFVPIGSNGFTNDKVLPGVNWLYGWEINDFLSTAGSTQFNLGRDGESGDEFLSIAQSWTIGYSLTDRVGAFTEWFMITYSGAEEELTQHYLDGGFTYLVNNNFQLDARIGKGISSSSDDYFVGAGAVMRF